MLTKSNIQCMMSYTADLLEENSARFSEIDAKFGDGDHGITISKVAGLIKNSAESWDSESIKGYFSDLGMAILAVKGGSAGPLYGTMIGGLTEDMAEELSEVSPSDLKAMFSSSLAEMQSISTAKVGDKTMMDALIPAVQAANNSDDDIEAILKNASEAALKGAKASEGFVSKFGRAKSYKEQTIGTADAGAESTATFIRGLYEGYLKSK